MVFVRKIPEEMNMKPAWRFRLIQKQKGLLQQRLSELSNVSSGRSNGLKNDRADLFALADQ